MKRIMYIERKDGGLDGPGRIGWVEMSRTSRSYVYQGRRFQKTRSGFKHNCFEEGTGVKYWISGPKKRGGVKLYGGVVEIDEDARVEYWTKIRGRPEDVERTQTTWSRIGTARVESGVSLKEQDKLATLVGY